MNRGKPLRLVLMDGRLAAEPAPSTALIAARGNEVRHVTVADIHARADRLRRSSRGGHRLIAALGFWIDAGMVFVLVERFDYAPVIARLVSIAVAITAMWMLRRRFNGRRTNSGRLADWLTFAGSKGPASVLSFITYAGVLLLFPGTPLLLAIVMGSVIALIARDLCPALFASSSPMPRHA